MTMNSKLFDKIRIKPEREQVAREKNPRCEWDGCENAGTHKAPKGRGREGQFFHYCVDHVREYNKTYNYFAGMADDAVRDYQKDALTGHRPTWTMGVNRAAGKTTADPDAAMLDPFGVLRAARVAGAHKAPPEPKRQVSVLTQKAFDTLDCDIGADKAAIKAKFKLLVKRHHPDANGGDRSTEERLRQIIQAYNYLKTAGFC